MWFAPSAEASATVLADSRGELQPSNMLSPLDLRLRVIALLAEPLLEVARASSLQLDDLRELVATEYFETLRRRGASWTAIAKRLGKSRRTVAELARRAAETEPARATNERLDAQRRLVRALAEGVHDVESLRRRVGAHFDDSLASLREAGIVSGPEDHPELAAALLDLVGPGVEERLASLRLFLESVAHVVYARFVRPREDQLAFARTWSFSGGPEALARLRDDAYAFLDARAHAIDAEAGVDAKPVTLSFVLVEPPDDERWRTR